MNAKEMNPFERHVEKIVLGVAAAGALYMGYLAMQPITIEGNSADDPIPIEKIQERLTGDVDKMHATEQTNLALGDIHPVIEDYRNNYKSIIQLNPLEPQIVSAVVPRFGPMGVAVNSTGNPNELPVNEDMKAVVFDPLPPEFVSLESKQQPVAIVPPAVPGVAAPTPVPGVPVATRDQNYALIQGYIPVAEMLVKMGREKQAPRNSPRLPDPLQRVVILRVEVQRREKLPGSKPETLPPSQAIPVPASASIIWNTIPPGQEELISRMDQVDQDFKTIVVPDFYPDDKGVPIQATNLTRPKTKDVVARETQLLDEVHKVQPPLPHPPGASANVAGPAAASPDDPVAAGPTMAPDVAALKNEALVPFAFWDDTVLPEHEYEYQVRIVYLNPGFNFARGLAKPELKGKAELASDWVKVPGSVRVKSDTMFFVTGPAVGGSMGGGASVKRAAEGASVKVFKRTNGKWYGSTFYVMPGLPIAGPVSLVDQPGKTMDVDTGYVLVDADTVNSTHVVLIDTTGKMITRDSSEDGANVNPQRKDLEASAEKATPITRPAPTTPVTPPARGPVIRTPPGRGTIDNPAP